MTRIVGRRQHLKCMYRSCFFVENAEIRERAADIDSDPVTHGSDCLSVSREVKVLWSIFGLTKADSVSNSAV